MAYRFRGGYDTDRAGKKLPAGYWALCFLRDDPYRNWWSAIDLRDWLRVPLGDVTAVSHLQLLRHHGLVEGVSTRRVGSRWARTAYYPAVVYRISEKGREVCAEIQRWIDRGEVRLFTFLDEVLILIRARDGLATAGEVFEVLAAETALRWVVARLQRFCRQGFLIQVGREGGRSQWTFAKAPDGPAARMAWHAARRKRFPWQYGADGVWLHDWETPRDVAEGRAKAKVDGKAREGAEVVRAVLRRRKGGRIPIKDGLDVFGARAVRRRFSGRTKAQIRAMLLE